MKARIKSSTNATLPVPKYFSSILVTLELNNLAISSCDENRIKVPPHPHPQDQDSWPSAGLGEWMLN